MKNLMRLFVLVVGMLVMSGMAQGVDKASELQARYTELIENEAGDSVRLHGLFDAAWEQLMLDSPTWATSVGYPGLNDRWSDESFEAIATRKKTGHRLLDVLRSIDRAALSEVDQLNYDLFGRNLAEGIEGDRFPGELQPINQMGGVQQDVAETIVWMPKGTVAECEDILARLKGVPKVIEQTMALLDSGLSAGITPPKATLTEVPQQVLNQIVDNTAEAPILKFLEEQPSTMTDADWERIGQEATAIYLEKIVPAYGRLHDYLVKTYLPGCRESVAWSDLPNGQEWYAFRVRHYTTTDMTPDEIFHLGHSEVSRIRVLMDEIITSTGFEGDFAAFCEFLRTDTQFFFTDAEELLKEYRDISKRVDPELISLFGHLPRLPYGVIPVPSYAEKSQTTAYYQPGSIKAGRPGYYYANTYDLASRPKWEMEALTLHEAVPGHHLQISISQELEGLPKFRKHGWYTAYGEGWALYAESLGEEMGFYADPYTKFGQLTYEMWRAIRLVVDVGMHAKGWSRQQAIDFFRANSSKSDHDIEVEIDRYIVWPGQALAYKIGELKIKELRARAELSLGAEFDIRAFHDELLGAGALPLEILERRMLRWQERQASD